MKKLFCSFLKKKDNPQELDISIPEFAYEKVDNQLERVCLRIFGQSSPGTFIGAVVLILNNEPISVVFSKNLTIPYSWQTQIKLFAKQHLKEIRQATSRSLKVELEAEKET